MCGCGGMRREEKPLRIARTMKGRKRVSTIEMIGVRHSSDPPLLAISQSLAIRQTLHFYATHLKESSRNPPQLILLSDDRRNREIAISEGLQAVSTRGYVDGLVGDVRQGLVDLVVGGVDELEPGERRGRRIYEEVGPFVLPKLDELVGLTVGADLATQYLAQETLNAGVKAGRYQQGHFNANQYNYLEVHLTRTSDL